MINIFRKKNKLTALLALTAAVLMLCTGCMRSGVGVIIEPDDTGTVEISVGPGSAAPAAPRWRW